MKILVCGGRDYENWERVKETLDKLNSEAPITSLVNGDADGADWLSTRWAKLQNPRPEIRRYPAAWDDLKATGAVIKKNKYGKLYNANAGPTRNWYMLQDNPDINLVVAFPGGSGTADMIRKAKDAGLKILQVD
jgi:hypothetical protein